MSGRDIARTTRAVLVLERERFLDRASLATGRFGALGGQSGWFGATRRNGNACLHDAARPFKHSRPDRQQVPAALRPALQRSIQPEAGAADGPDTVRRQPDPGAVEPGASSQRQWHSHKDEFVWVLEGELTLFTDAGAEILRTGDGAAFERGDPDGRYLVKSVRAPGRNGRGARHSNPGTLVSKAKFQRAPHLACSTSSRLYARLGRPADRTILSAISRMTAPIKAMTMVPAMPASGACQCIL
jgi:uncharacterized cupin superfamily protein